MDFVASGERGRARTTSFHEDAGEDDDLAIKKIITSTISYPPWG
jgi:hypothetical protein